MTAPTEYTIGPQPGPQTAFMASPADIVVLGGGAGGGKTVGLLLQAVYHHPVAGYNAIIFRRTTTAIRGGGGLWEESTKFYPLFAGKPREVPLDWTFPSGARVAFGHLEHEKDKLSHQGRQYAFIGFDEITHFTESQFWYLHSRNRSTCGVRPYVRATCNPDANSWVRRLLDWWIGPDGLAIEERSGVLRWFVRDGDALVWADTPEELRERHPGSEPQSLTFIPSKLEDNPALVEKDPGYRARLQGLPRVERAQLLGRNWNAVATSGSYFRRSYFEIVDKTPGTVAKRTRAWDLAASEPSAQYPDPDWTVGAKAAKLSDGRLCVEHVERIRRTGGAVDRAQRNLAKQDGPAVVVGLWQDPGQAGKAQIEHKRRLLRGFRIDARLASKDKQTYAGPPSSDAEAGQILIVRGEWNDAFLDVLESFPDGAHDDDVDALSLAHLILVDTGFVWM